VSHAWPNGLPIEVVCDAQTTPTRLRGGWHAVVEVTTRWRVRRAWWRADRWREYVTVATASHLLLTLARDLPHGAWLLIYLHV